MTKGDYKVTSTSSEWQEHPLTKYVHPLAAYMLADEGYDVWLGNVRGNTYCRSHVNMTADEPKFWKFR